MTNKELINGLKDLGLSDSAILAVLSEQTTTAAPAATAAVDAPAPAAAPEPEAPAPAAAPAAPAPDPREDKILSAIEKLTGAIFASNARSTGRDTPAQDTVDDVLAKIQITR